ncbi:MAG: CapA family protein [bacterium]
MPRIALFVLLLALVPAPGSALEAAPVRLVFVGDNLLGVSMGTRMAQAGPDYPYALVADYLRSADFCFGNLECPLTNAVIPTTGKDPAKVEAKIEFVFRADPTLSGEALERAGFDCLSVANNHAMDFGPDGMRETLATLQSHGIVAAGGGTNITAAMAPRFFELPDLTVGVLAASMINPIGSPATADRPGDYCVPKAWTTTLEQQIRALDQRADLVILSLHWGVEATMVPTDYQRDVAAAAIAAGADLIIGHHPHVLQPVVFDGQHVIAYSLGNFCFTGKSHTMPTAILEVSATREGIQDCRLVPILITEGRPAFSQDPHVLDLLSILAPGIAVADSLALPAYNPPDDHGYF